MNSNCLVISTSELGTLSYYTVLSSLITEEVREAIDTHHERALWLIQMNDEYYKDGDDDIYCLSEVIPDVLRPLWGKIHTILGMQEVGHGVLMQGSFVNILTFNNCVIH